MKDELMYHVDEEDKVIGVVPKDDIEKNHLTCRGAAAFVFNNQGKIFIHQRSFDKESFAGYYDFLVGGGVKFGESYEEAVKREIQEEVGFNNFSVNYLFKEKAQSKRNIWLGIFKCISNDQVKIQEDEIIHGKFVSIERLKKMIKTEKFCPNLFPILRRYLEEHHETT